MAERRNDDDVRDSIRDITISIKQEQNIKLRYNLKERKEKGKRRKGGKGGGEVPSPS